jgi:hypothetical protein
MDSMCALVVMRTTVRIDDTLMSFDCCDQQGCVISCTHVACNDFSLWVWHEILPPAGVLPPQSQLIFIVTCLIPIVTAPADHLHYYHRAS